MPYRVAAGVLELLLPIDAGSAPETLRACTLKVGADLVDTAATDPAVAASEPVRRRGVPAGADRDATLR